MTEIKTRRNLIDKDELIADYKKEHKGPPGKALGLIKRAHVVDTSMGIAEFYKMRENFCSSTRCFECPARTYCGDMHAEAEHAEDFIQIINDWLENKEKRQSGGGKTYLEEFYEKYPDAERNADGTPYSVCRKAIVGRKQDKSCGYLQTCFDCWNEIIRQ